MLLAEQGQCSSWSGQASPCIWSRPSRAETSVLCLSKENCHLQSSDDATLTTISGLRDEACRAMGSHNVSCVQDFFTCEVSPWPYPSTGAALYMLPGSTERGSTERALAPEEL